MVLEVACGNGRPEMELRASWSPLYMTRTRWLRYPNRNDPINEWVIVAEWDIGMGYWNGIPRPHKWYLQRSNINMNPGTYSFYCKLYALLEERAYFQKEE